MPVEPRQDRLRLLVAGLEGELARVERLVAEFEHARAALVERDCDVLVVYGAAALLESFYTGMEKALRRVATGLGGMPTGDGWHRDLLESMTLVIDSVRPAVLSAATATAIDPYLGFRHRFRNLYVFDLERAPMLLLLERGASAHAMFAGEMHSFVAKLRTWIGELEPPA